ncbi:MAG: hypothetical protein LUF34_02625 [Lachnospiraceae bacterium]|nr:hypothetical protein [Lachnospiraceae bacterium]
MILCPEVEEVPAAEARAVDLEARAVDSEVLMEVREVRPHRLAEAGDGAAAIAAADAACPAA